MKHALYRLSIVLAFAAPCNAQLADRCSDVLRSGIFNEHRQLNQSNYKSQMRRALCSSSESSQENSSGHGASAGLLKLNLGYNDNSAEADSLKQKYCQSEGGALSSNDLNWVMQRIASEAVLAAWSRCMSEIVHKSGLVGTIDDVNGENFSFKVRWIAAYGVNDVRVSVFDPKGASCEPRVLEPGTVITTDEVTQPCVRSGPGPVSLVLNTNHGTAVGTLAAIAARQKSRSELKVSCMSDESVEDCMALFKRSATKCQQDDIICTGNASCWKSRSLNLSLIANGCPSTLTQKQCDYAMASAKSMYRGDCDTLLKGIRKGEGR